MTDLRPCPFCAQTPSIWTPAICLGDDETDVDYMQISCRCGVSGPQFRFRDHSRKSANFMAVEANCAKHWNTRAAQPKEINQ